MATNGEACYYRKQRTTWFVESWQLMIGKERGAALIGRAPAS